jgi:SAM-dependent methyltransferase
MQKMLDIIDYNFKEGRCKVADFGGRRIIGQDESYYKFFEDNPNVEYLGVDIEEGPGVDVVLSDPYKSPFDADSIDIVVSGQMLEHCEFFWLVISEIARILKPGGYLLIVAPSRGKVHRYPVDCWRFYPDAYAAMAKWSGLTLVDSWTDIDTEWCDAVGILRKLND